MSTTESTKGKMLRVTVYLEIADADLAAGWAGDDSEFEASVKATLHEIVGDDGNVYVPHVFGLEIDPDDEPAA